MEHASYDQILRHLKAQRHRDTDQAPIALVLVDSAVLRDATVRHCLEASFGTVIAIGTLDGALPDAWTQNVHTAPFDVHRPGAYPTALNALIAAVPGRWVHICYAGEFLFWPFGDHRDVCDLTSFVQEERRRSIAGLVVDLYGETSGEPPSAEAGSECWLDHDGYAAEPVRDSQGRDLPRQLAVRGGLRLRLGSVLEVSQRIDRILLVRASDGLEMRPDLSFNLPEYNTRHSPWHRSATAVLCSDRAARALANHKDRARAPARLVWRGSARFDWTAQQLTQLGLMEPGQWV